jgi:hypothetical protein
MRYLCLMHVDQSLIDALTPEALAEMDRQNQAYDASLIESGHYVTALALGEPETAKVVRSRGGRVSTTDGPYVETKEHLGGFILIEARDLDEALAIAQRDPMARYGSIEVRPEMGLDWQRQQQGR